MTYLRSTAAFLRRHAVLFIILIIAGYIRLSDLGRQSYWFDEAGVAVAASQNSPLQALEIAKGHVAAPPLDYLVAWCMGRFSLQEGWLRLPAAIWGIASIAVMYRFAAELLSRPAALLCGLLIAVAPAHIYLSQELRAYSAWFFFYWLTTLFLYHAVRTPTSRGWLRVVAACVAGSYFHFYTLLALINGLFFLAASPGRKQHGLIVIRQFCMAAIAILVLVLPGFLVFSNVPFIGYRQEWNHLLSLIGISLGWFPLSNEPNGFVLGFIILSCAGLILSIISRKWDLAGLAISAAIQIALITLASFIKGYFFAWRYYFALLPVTFLLTAFTLQKIAAHGGPLLVRQAEAAPNLQAANRIIAVMILLGLLFASGVEIQKLRQDIKSNGRLVSGMISQMWQPGDQIWTVPWYEPLLFRFYLENIFQDTRMTGQFSGYEIDTLPDPSLNRGRTILVTRQLSPEDTARLFTQGFQATPLAYGPHWVWIFSH